jgi:iron complex transport system ATP-binding protein
MHDLNLASRFSDKILMLKKGSIYAVGTPEAVLTEESIEDVYGIKAKVSTSVVGKPQITPILTDTYGSVSPKRFPLTEETLALRRK